MQTQSQFRSKKSFLFKKKQFLCERWEVDYEKRKWKPDFAAYEFPAKTLPPVRHCDVINFEVFCRIWPVAAPLKYSKVPKFRQWIPQNTTCSTIHQENWARANVINIYDVMANWCANLCGASPLVFRASRGCWLNKTLLAVRVAFAAL